MRIEKLQVSVETLRLACILALRISNFQSNPVTWEMVHYYPPATRNLRRYLLSHGMIFPVRDGESEVEKPLRWYVLGRCV